MIYDCFSFFNKLDIHEIRLNVLNSVVDKFALVEAVIRHSGEPKELFQLKIKSIAENVCDSVRNISVEDIKKQITKGTDSFGRGGRFYAVPRDVSYPEYIRQNKYKYAIYH